MRETLQGKAAEREAGERGGAGRPLTREEFYFQQIDGRTRARKRAILGAIAAAFFALALIFPAAAPWLLLAGIFSGIGIGWVE